MRTRDLQDKDRKNALFRFTKFLLYYIIQKYFEIIFNNTQSFPERDNRPKGGKNMDKYEILYIIRAGVDDDQKTKVVEKFEALTGNLGGTVDSIDKLGLKKFAYEIDKQTEGYYVLMNVTCENEVQIEIGRQMRNDEAIIRYMIVKK